MHASKSLLRFIHAFRSYGVTLWYPTYVNKLNLDKDAEIFQAFCSKEVSNLSNSSLPEYCGCSESYINSSIISDTQMEKFLISGAVFSNVTFERVDFSSSSFKNTTFESGSFVECSFNFSAFTQVIFKNFTFINLSLEHSRLCGVFATGSTSNSVAVKDSSINHFSSNDTIPNLDGTRFIEMLNTTNTSQCEGEEKSIECPKKEDDFRVYRDSFFISASALPGNLASIVAVYFLIRKYWLCKTVLGVVV